MRFTLSLFLFLLPATLMAQHEHQHAHEGHQHAEHQHGEQQHGHDGHGADDPSHGVHHDFSDVDRWLARFEGPKRDAYQKPAYLIELMAIEPGMTVADIGAGTGYFLPYLSKAVGPEGKALGLDVEPNLVHFMQERIANEGWANTEARLIPYDDPQLAPGSVDRILIVNTWHHIDHRGAYAAKLREALAPGGEVWIVDFTKESPHGPAVEHRLTAAQVIEELGAGGLKGTAREEGLEWQYVVVASVP
jgi:ubiquinone/menaquinone biosynthesis C-methylase UbiE